jgi:hypothetical protein
VEFSRYKDERGSYLLAINAHKQRSTEEICPGLDALLAPDTADLAASALAL